MSTGKAFVLPLAWNPSLGITRHLSIAWLQTQPLIELFVAAGIGSRHQIRTLARQGGLSYLFEDRPYEDQIEEQITADRTRYRERVMAYWAALAYDQLAERDVLVWTPVTAHDLMLPTDLREGIVVVKQGKRTLKRIILREDG